MQTCFHCNGLGYMEVQSKCPYCNPSSQSNCNKCGGTGIVPQRATCYHCKGAGVVK